MLLFNTNPYQHSLWLTSAGALSSSVYKAGNHDPRREWGMLPPYNPQFEQMLQAAVTP